MQALNNEIIGVGYISGISTGIIFSLTRSFSFQLKNNKNVKLSYLTQISSNLFITVGHFIFSNTITKSYYLLFSNYFIPIIDMIDSRFSFSVIRKITKLSQNMLVSSGNCDGYG